MNASLFFWVLMLVWFIVGIWGKVPMNAETVKASAGSVLLFVLLVLLGWRVFGPPVQGLGEATKPAKVAWVG